LPDELYGIITDPAKRKRLIIYINPPYAEIAGNKVGVNLSAVHDKYAALLRGANRELFAQFLMRIYMEIPDAYITNFSTLKNLSGSHFKTFRDTFLARLERLFIVPANTFDNVNGQFPIGFFIWNTQVKERFEQIEADVYDAHGLLEAAKMVYCYDNVRYFSIWVNSFKKKSGIYLGWLEGVTCNDFQGQRTIHIRNFPNKKAEVIVSRGSAIYDTNLVEASICFAVRKVISAIWLNNRDQFLYPNDGWQQDADFQNNCIVYTLFRNNIQSRHGINHWIPFTEEEVKAQYKFESKFMSHFLKDRTFSIEAQAVLDAGLGLWRYYLSQKNANVNVNVNAALYDIREYFQGRNDNGKMNNKSNDEQYNALMAILRNALKTLAQAIAPKVYEYGFLSR
jgi:hypothetical protein